MAAFSNLAFDINAFDTDAFDIGTPIPVIPGVNSEPIDSEDVDSLPIDSEDVS